MYNWFWNDSNDNEERFSMDLFNQNENHKRKLSQSIEREQNWKIENEQSVGCFSRCCKRKKRQIISDQNEKRKKISIPMPHLTRSPFFTETTFCQLDDDPCLQCDVQYGPDIWENTPKCSHKVNFCFVAFHYNQYRTIFSLWPTGEPMKRKMWLLKSNRWQMQLQQNQRRIWTAISIEKIHLILHPRKKNHRLIVLMTINPMKSWQILTVWMNCQNCRINCYF